MAVETKEFWTKHGYRLVTEEDLVAGAEFVMAEMGISHDLSVDPKLFGMAIKLDDRPVENGNVYFHLVQPADDTQCFIPVRAFLEVNEKVVLVKMRV